VRRAISEIVVVGGSLAGVAAIEELRGRGYCGRIVLVGAEAELPYDRPPLSKQVLTGTLSARSCRLRDDDWHDTHEVELALGTWATALDPGRRELTLGDGRTTSYDGLVIATGVTARELDGPRLSGVHTLRTLDDAQALQRAFAHGSRVAIVGGGFIGAEVAASARAVGLEVTLIEALATPRARVLGPTVGTVCGRLHTDHGVHLRCGVPVRSVAGIDGHVDRVVLADDSIVEADVVVVGLGVRPAVAWLDGSGVEVADGVLCDAACRTNAPGVVAAGDVARWPHPTLGSIRVEHWQNAVMQGCAAAAALLEPRRTEPYGPIPYVWSDQFDVNIQVAGEPRAEDEVAILGTPDDYRFTALYGRHGRLSAGVSFNSRGATRRVTRLLAAGASFERAQEAMHDPGPLPLPAVAFIPDPLGEVT
jgi:NADPH-dependent 2,4-dienoyl-CoA reductase/sulfur reductase-like enzyme